MAYTLAENYFKNAGWLYKAVPEEQIMGEIPLAFLLTAGGGFPSSLARSEEKEGIASDETGSTSRHSLALLLTLFVLGSDGPGPAPALPEAEHYHQLAKVALGMQPVLEMPSVVTV
jgi:hypothetical protein